MEADPRSQDGQQQDEWRAVEELRSTIPAGAWRHMDAVDLEELFSHPIRTVREPPRWFRSQLRKAYQVAMSEWRRTGRAGAWKVFLLIPRMLLGPTESQGEAGKAVFMERMRQFLRGDWQQLLRRVPAQKVGHRELDE